MKIECTLDYDKIMANQATPIFLAVKLNADTFAASARPKPIAFCVVLDRSGSMQGSPIAMAREATKQVIRNLRSEDYLSVIAFDDVAEPVIPLQQISSKQSAIEKIQNADSHPKRNFLRKLRTAWQLPCCDTGRWKY